MTEATGTVLVGVDDTPQAWLAADWAAREATLRGAALQVVHAVTDADERVRGAAADLLEDARTRITTAHPGLRIDTVLGQGEPAEAVLTAAEDTDAGLIVLGTRGRGGFAGLLLGSVSLKVAAHAGRPVVVARGHTEKAGHDGIMAGVRDERDEVAVRFALAEAELRGAPVRLVHAWSPLARAGLMVPQVSTLDDEQHAHAQVLKHAARPAAAYPRLRVEQELITGPPAGVLVEASAKAGLLVLPRHPAEGRFGLRLGSVVHAVLHHADCPVAVVPTS
ncbi:universal stress protein [Streptomyces sp. NPDC002814]